MKISQKLVDEVVSELAGADVVPLVALLRNKTNVSEFLLAEKLDVEINLVRNMLYRLYDNSLVSFTRKKDKKKGWYIYYWTFNPKRVRELIVDIKKKKLRKLKERLMREKNNQFFICENECMRLDFEQAHDYKFKCPECGVLLNVQDNRKTIERLEKECEKAENELKLIEEAVAKEEKAAKEAAAKRAEREEKKEAKEKEAAKKAKKKAVKKAKKKTTKKKVKKKVAKKAKKTAKKKAVKKTKKTAKKKTKKAAKTKKKTTKKKTVRKAVKRKAKTAKSKKKAAKTKKKTRS